MRLLARLLRAAALHDSPRVVETRSGLMQDCSIVRRKGNLEAGRRAMKSQIVKRSTSAKRSVLIAGHRTSVSLEDAFWKALKEIAGERDMTLSNLVAAINSERQLNNLPSAVRLFVLGL